jgi:hypothetical protein
VSLDVFDVMGRHVRELVHSGMASGRTVVEWDGRDDHGRAVSSGVLAAGGGIEHCHETDDAAQVTNGIDETRGGTTPS